MEVEFHPAADDELSAACAQYERHLAGLGQDLVDEVHSVCVLVAEYPAIGRKVDQIRLDGPR